MIDTFEYKILDHGVLALLDIMGSDHAICEAARISYKKGKKSDDRKLIRYLMRHQHWSPFEMAEMKFYVKAPIFVFRQWHRHRSACVASNCVLNFDLPSGPKKNKRKFFGRTVKDFYNLWHNGIPYNANTKKKPLYIEKINKDKTYTVPELSILVNRSKETIREFCQKQKIKATKKNKQWNIKGIDYINWANENTKYFIPIRDRLKQMKLRCVNEDTLETTYTSITDIWSNGIKTIYNLKLENGYEIQTTEDHLFFTEQGWLKLKDAYDLLNNKPKVKFAVLSPIGNNYCKDIKIDTDNEIWKPILNFENRYKISNMGRVYSELSNRVLKPGSVYSRGNIQNRYYIVGLTKNGKTRPYFVHRIVLDSFFGPRKEKEQCRHLNGNSLDNRIENLKWGTNKENAKDRKKHNSTTKLRLNFISAKDCAIIGKEEVFDIEVSGEFHNFSCNNFIVHNSINEISGRYSELPDDIFHPVTLYTQDKKNKQLSSDKEVVYQIKSYEKSYQEYQDMLDAGVSKEYSRIVLPLAIYSEMYWKCDLRNILHFIKLRMSPDAQGAIREYAKIMAEIVERCFPLTWEAFQDYELEAITFSKQELFLLKTLLNNKEIIDTKLDKSEQEEFNSKLKLLNNYE